MIVIILLVILLLVSFKMDNEDPLKALAMIALICTIITLLVK